MKQGNWRKKLEYFWMYYKIPFLAVLGVCVVIVYFGYAKITEKEYAFNAILLDIHTNAQEEMLEEEFADYAGIDTKKYDVLISTSLLFSDSSSGNYAMTSLARLYTQICVRCLQRKNWNSSRTSTWMKRGVCSECIMKGWTRFRRSGDIRMKQVWPVSCITQNMWTRRSNF